MATNEMPNGCGSSIEAVLASNQKEDAFRKTKLGSLPLLPRGQFDVECESNALNSSVGRFVNALDGCIQNGVILLVGLLE